MIIVIEYALMSELVDEQDSESCACNGRAGSTPAGGTTEDMRMESDLVGSEMPARVEGSSPLSSAYASAEHW